MGFLSDVVKTVTKVVEDVVAVGTDALAKVVRSVAKMQMTLEYFVDRMTDVVTAAYGAAAGTLVPEEVGRWISLIEFVVDTAAGLPSAFLNNLANAIKTGTLLNIVDVITPTVTQAMKEAREHARSGSLKIPEEIRDLIPDQNDRAWIAEAVRYTTVERTDNKGFFYVWRFFKGDATAITLMDTIVFDNVPDFQNSATVFLMLHELKHTLQFRDLGTETFMRRYLVEKARSREPVALEVEADHYACSIMPWGQPHYIDFCPISPAHLSEIATSGIPILGASEQEPSSKS
jgi:hypothetical protein